MLDVSRVSVKGQVTIPVEIRRKLRLRSGDKVIFAEKNGEIVVVNANRVAFEEWNNSMVGEAEKAGINTTQDVVDIVNDVRREIWERDYEGNA